MPKTLTYREALDVLDSAIRAGIKLGLDNTERLLAALGDPHRRVKFVHVAGTNGKGSVCTLLSAALTEAGYRTGLFTSPHLVSVRERMRVNGEPIAREEFARHVERVQAAVEELTAQDSEYSPTFFEWITVLAMLFFDAQAVDLVVMEVGMGGRLDSTNVIEPELTVITSIDFDHTNALGETLAEIAGEKAGIIKDGVPIVCGEIKEGAIERIAAVAAERQAPLLLRGREFDVVTQRLEQTGAGPRQHAKIRWREELHEIEMRLLGNHQAENCAVALAALGVLRERGLGLDPVSVRTGLGRALWPARLERLPDGIWLDAAHNPGGVEALLEALGRLRPEGRWQILFGVLRDKPWQAMLARLAPSCERLFVARVNNHRAEAPETVLDYVRQQMPQLPASICEDAADGLEPLRQGGRGLIVGSLFLAGEVLAHYTNGEPVRIMAEN